MQKKDGGFSFTEILVSLTVILILAAIGLPIVDRSLSAYRLNSAASDIANIFQRTRYEAIKQNTVVVCRGQQQGGGAGGGGDWVVWIDLNNNGALDATEPQILLHGPVTFVGADVAPSPASMGYPNAKVPSGSIAFDSRGALSFGGGASTVYVVYLGYTGQPDFGYRALTVIPSGKTKVWSAAKGGTWHTQ